MIFFVPKMKFQKKLNHFLLQNPDFTDLLALTLIFYKTQNSCLINKTFIINQYTFGVC
jgi:hypothetical protein